MFDDVRFPSLALIDRETHLQNRKFPQEDHAETPHDSGRIEALLSLDDERSH